MLCIFCRETHDPSCEHVFPLAIGGTVTTDRVCKACNDMLGSRVDAALSDFFPIRMRRADLQLAGNSKEPPAWYEMFLGEAKLVGQAADRIVTRFNKKTGKLETRQLHHAMDVVTPDGKKSRQITLDARDKDQFPKIIQRERKRHGMPPMSDDQLAATLAFIKTTTIEQPLVFREFRFSFAYLRHAMFKIAYELAFLWLGESYLSDPLAIKICRAVCNSDLASTNELIGFVGVADECYVLNKFWEPHRDHHLAYASVVMGQSIAVCIRIFDIYAAAIVISENPGRYINSNTDREKLRFLAIDAAQKREINTPFDIESLRIGRLMSTENRLPPFPDPLA